MKHCRLRVGLALSVSCALGAAEAAHGQQPATTAPTAGATTPAAGLASAASPAAGNAAAAAAPRPAGQAPLGAPAPIAPAQPAGFPLSAIEQQLVYQTLTMWEQNSQEIDTFSSRFERWEYDAVFGPGTEIPLIKCTGAISFSKPDKGSFKIEKINRWTKKDPQNSAPDAPGDWLPQPNEVGEHWVCDGKAVYEYNHRNKQLVVTTIPENMRGAGIVDGPLPFLFGARADKLSQRYWIRTKQSDPAEIWLEAYPRWQSDAANYDYVDVMLDRKTMQPKAIQVHLPGGQQWHVYMFQDAKVNETNLGAWFTGLFSAPRTPIGWTKVNADAPPPQAANPQSPLQR